MNTKSLRTLLNHSLFFSALVFAWGLFYFLYGERLPANDGLGWDGYRYASIARDFIHSTAIDSYTCMRILPSFIIHLLFKLFNISFSDANIVNAFEIFNIFCLTLGAYFIKKLFVHLKISFKNQVLGFFLLFLNFGCSKFIYYYPVLTDSAGFLLGIMVLYFYLTDQFAKTVLITTIAVFTWPPVFFQGLILLMFPILKNTYKALEKKYLYLICLASVVYFATIIFIFVLLKKEDIPLLYTLKIDQALLPLSVISFLFFSFFLPLSIANKNFFSFNNLKQNFNLKSLIIIPIILLFFALIKYLLHPAQSEYMTLGHFIANYPIYGLAEPFIYLVADAAHYGVVIILMLFFWKEMCATISEFGVGLTLAFLLNLYLYNFWTESRSAINFFPWIAIFMIIVLEKYKLKNGVYVILIGINFLVSKIWLTIGYDLNTGLDKNGSVAFPNQKMFMTGPWMTKEMWMIQYIILLLYALLIFMMIRFSYIEKKEKIS